MIKKLEFRISARIFLAHFFLLAALCGFTTTGYGEDPNKTADPKDQFVLGVAYLEGKGVAKDAQQAGCWFRKSAEQGYAPAWNALGSLYYNGLGTPRNYPQASECFEKASRMGEPKSLYNLGMMQEKGYGCTIDFKKALGLYEQSEKAGYARAALKLGAIYYYGDYGEVKDYHKAWTHFLIGSRLGDAASDNFLASMVEHGQGVPEKGCNALMLYRRAAHAGDLTAQANLGRLYIEGGCGLKKDEFKGIEWLCFAEAAGYGNATTMIGQFSQLLEPSLVEAARSSAKQMLAKGAKVPE
jgi:TPR repeat protein